MPRYRKHPLPQDRESHRLVSGLGEGTVAPVSHLDKRVAWILPPAPGMLTWKALSRGLPKYFSASQLAQLLHRLRLSEAL